MITWKKEHITGPAPKVFFLTILILIVINITEGKTMNKYIITKDDNNKEIIIKSGDLIQIELETSGATGYTWHINNLDREYLVLILEGIKENTVEGKVGAPIFRYWQLKALKKGVTELEMLYFRPWEGAGKSVEKFRIKLNIK